MMTTMCVILMAVGAGSSGSVLFSCLSPFSYPSSDEGMEWQRGGAAVAATWEDGTADKITR